MERADLQWLDALVISPDRFLAFRQQLFERRGRMAAWLLHAGRRHNHEDFRAWLAEQHPDLSGELMDQLSTGLTEPLPDLICWLDTGFGFVPVLHVVDGSGLLGSYTPADAEWQQILPDPGSDWTLEPA